jgi:hypothetical protein
LSLSQTDPKYPIPSWRYRYYYSSPFNAEVSPTAFVQLKAQPYTIIYQPTGNQSNVTFSTNTNYSTSFTLGTSTTTSNKTSVQHTESEEQSVSGTLKDILSLDVTDNNKTSWDQTTSQTFGDTTTSSTTSGQSLGIKGSWKRSANIAAVPGSGKFCVMQNGSCSALQTDPNLYLDQPFWEDMFVLLVHPQFAYFSAGSGQDQYEWYAATPVTVDVTVGRLVDCVAGTPLFNRQIDDPCKLPFSNDVLTDQDIHTIVYTGIADSITLTNSEALDLLNLDPFYKFGQSAPLDVSRALIIAHPSYGAQAPAGPYELQGDLSSPYSAELDNTMTQQSSSSKQLSSESSVTDILGYSETIGIKVGLGDKDGQADANLTEGLTIDNGDKSTGEASMKTLYSDSTAVSTTQTTTATVTLDDFDNTTPGNNGAACKVCHPPVPQQPSVNILLDTKFGGFMFQDPRAPVYIAPTDQIQPVPQTKVISWALHEEMSRKRFSDLPDSLPAKGAIGVLAAAHIVAGFPDKTFHPADALSLGDLAASLTSALEVPVGGSTQNLAVGNSDLAEAAISAATKAGLLNMGPNASFTAGYVVSRQALAASLAASFHLKPAPINAPDKMQVASWANGAVGAVLMAGYMTTDQNGNFQPSAPVNRADAALALFGALRDHAIANDKAGSGPQAASAISIVSGKNQTGKPGQPLAAPFVVKTTDITGNPVPGISVTFAVTAGGGTLSATQVFSDAQGLASSTLTLGSATGTNTVAVASPVFRAAS